MPILHRVYELYKLFYQYEQHLPQKDRYCIGQKCEKIILDILELIIGTIQSPKNRKLELLNEASIKLNILRIIIRLSKDIKALDFKKYITLQENINEIGRMLGGWIKSLK
ncbi:diversity-generating retroelement protein Avd [Patescibacteria group bacterium]|nr:diversity-generating retroelement protein Avd [Patescibacteria group bacterium]MBU4367420.1 diversity-generating retroelement protein Avd [Patescibacteria group bacterium]MBU4461740.1 diversity-generating retroelement protein Avd [Patescibacteria group bacterium]MCG2700124.1 diversity-generating retroelement protein Avd [Candidatus Parcubacteria bacterium]